MKKLLISMIFILILSSCTSLNLDKKYTTFEEKQSLILLIENIKTNLKSGKITKMEENLVSSYKNKKILEMLEKIDFSKINILSSKPEFAGDKASNTVAMIYNDGTMYFDVDYLFENDKWKIADFKERRGENEN